MKITTDNIKSYAGQDVFNKGLRYYKQNKVRLMDVELLNFEATVNGSDDYIVNVELVGDKIYGSCTCPYWTTCKHIVAALLTAKDFYNKNLDNLIYQKSHPPWKSFFDKIIEERGENGIGPKANQLWKVVYILELENETWALTPQKAYIKKTGELGRTSNIGDFDSENSSLLYAPNDPYIVSFIQNKPEKNYSFYNYYAYSDHNEFQVSHLKYGADLGPLFDFLIKSALFLKEEDGELFKLFFNKIEGKIEFRYNEDEKNFQLSPIIELGDESIPLSNDFKILSQNPVWLLRDDTLIRISNIKNAELLLPFTKDSIELTIPKNEFPEFLDKTYPQLSVTTRLPLPESINVTTTFEITAKRIYLHEGFNQLEVFLKFLYGEKEIDFNDPQQEFFNTQGGQIVKIIRNNDKEVEAYEKLIQSGLRVIPRGGLRVIDSKALNWMFTNIPKLSSDNFEIIGRERLKKYKIRTGDPVVSVAVTTKIDWFDLNIKVNIEGIDLSLKELKKSIKKNQRYVRLKDRSIARISENWFEKFQHLFNFSEVDEESVHVSRYHATLIDILFSKTENSHTDQEYRQSLRELKEFEGIKEQPLPPGITGTLRPYQIAGYNWLLFLKQFNFGGCLADDMGLGKTLQTLAIILKEKLENKNFTSLIVCPTSVVFNWELEVQKFTPSLTTILHAGLKREKNTKSFKNYDIILTSYGTMRQDITFLKDFNFHYVILDESQKIKNPQSQTAKAARILSANHRLVLTGTPVENNTVELWSQFSFLNPGLLGSLNYFRKAFTLPIERKNDEAAASFLRQMIFPFILRRTKEHVAKELPPKNEQTFYCAMNTEQEALYAQWRDFYRAKILSKIDTVGLDKARMNVLEGLVRLRQISCHPNLVDKNIKEDSGKFETLKEFVEEILAEKHKILIFSQFVKMLKIIRGHFDETGIEYEYLDGHITDRKKCVERFQNDDNVRVFLISLKAGGTGLNLTAADYVIHYDPWWNPAVEMQATDRAHRIGQDKNVFVYRLITQGSVEEKMLKLQDRKRKLVSDLISTDASVFKSLTRDDVEILFT
jgi:non-specific serine/threonine protein kinase